MSDINEELLSRAQSVWDRFKYHIVLGTMMALSAAAGLAWQSLNLDAKRDEAGGRLFALMRAADAGDLDRAAAELEKIDAKEFPEVRNLGRIALAAAKDSAGEPEAAVESLREAVVAAEDDGLRFMASMRLAEALINAGQSDEALAALEEFDPPTPVMRMLLLDRRGDAHLTAGRSLQARALYGEALEEANRAYGSYVPVLRIKIAAAVSIPAENGAVEEGNSQ